MLRIEVPFGSLGVVMDRPRYRTLLVIVWSLGENPEERLRLLMTSGVGRNRRPGLHETDRNDGDRYCCQSLPVHLHDIPQFHKLRLTAPSIRAGT